MTPEQKAKKAEHDRVCRVFHNCFNTPSGREVLEILRTRIGGRKPMDFRPAGLDALVGWSMEEARRSGQLDIVEQIEGELKKFENLQKGVAT